MKSTIKIPKLSNLKTCLNCKFSGLEYGNDTLEQARLLICNRLVPHISTNVDRNNLGNTEIILRRKETEEMYLNKTANELPYLLVPSNFFCNKFELKKI